MDYTIEELSKRASALQNTGNELVSRKMELNIISNAVKWKSDALAFQKMVTTFKMDLSNCHQAEEKMLLEAEAELKNLPFFKRITTSKTEVNQHKENIESIDEGLKSIGASMGVLSGIIDEVPTSMIEVKSQISGLSVRKRELVVEKREVNEEMRRIRTKARQDRAKWKGVHGKYMGKVASGAREGITRTEENNLSPFESEKGKIEYELIDIEKKLNWLNGFTSDDIDTIEDKIFRCAYCGRRVNLGDVCPGCGSDQTILELN